MNITEKLLHFIWQHNHFTTNDLCTTSGIAVNIIDPGKLNHDQGPDFKEAKIRIGNELWFGHVELHINASDWHKHRHSSDELYKNVILHVVWKEDVVLHLPFPVVELRGRVSGILLKKFEQLMQSPQFISCRDQISGIAGIILNTWKQRLLVERLQSRAEQIISLLQINNYHWEEAFWWMLASGFGMKVNSASFLKIAQSIPFNILLKHRKQIILIEALLLGQAGILDTTFTEHYPLMLSKEYNFLKKKYNLQKIHYPLYYLRMRPANFPTVRLAQLAALFHREEHFFTSCIEAMNVKDVEKKLMVQANDYWHYHYLPGAPSSFKIKKAGKDMAENILINCIIPCIYAYGAHQKIPALTLKAINWLENLPAENNTIIRQFKGSGLAVPTAFDSQALIQMKNEYCNAKRCLECSVGYKLLYETDPVKV